MSPAVVLLSSFLASHSSSFCSLFIFFVSRGDCSENSSATLRSLLLCDPCVKPTQDQCRKESPLPHPSLPVLHPPLPYRHSHNRRLQKHLLYLLHFYQ